jgi:hypothetical protein
VSRDRHLETTPGAVLAADLLLGSVEEDRYTGTSALVQNA